MREPPESGGHLADPAGGTLPRRMADIREMGAVRGDDGRRRCAWAGSTQEYQAYHDDEWGRPVVDDVRLYEKLCLEGFQSGLSWLTILRKREGFRAAFAGFEPEKVAAFDDGDVARLLGDAGIVRHRGKIEAAIANARATLAVQADRGSLAALVWEFEPTAAGPGGTRPPRRPGAADAGVGGPGESLATLRVPLRRADDGLRRHAVARARERPPAGLPRAGRLRRGTPSDQPCGDLPAARSCPTVHGAAVPSVLVIELSRRQFLGRLGLVYGAVSAGPVLWQRPAASAGRPRAARIGWGADPRTTLTVSWATPTPVRNPVVELGVDDSFGRVLAAETRTVPGWPVNYHRVTMDGPGAGPGLPLPDPP